MRTIPVLTYEGIVLTQEQKEAMIKGLTEVAEKIIPDIPKSSYYVFFKEYPPEMIGVGGMTLPKYLKSMEQS